MAHFSTREAAKKLGLSHTTLARYIETGKVPTPKTVLTSNTVVHLWTQEEIENVRKLLPKIANGRKTRYQKQRQKKSTGTSKQ
jgi:predicted DNA-binding transcriptional regulator AlpA